MDQIKSCAKCFNQLATLIQKSKLQNIVKKFKTSKFFEVARIIQNSSSSRVMATNGSQSKSSTQKADSKRNQSFASLPSSSKYGLKSSQVK